MDSIVNVLGGVSPSSITFNNDDDAVDKLSHRYTAIMLVIFAVVLSTKTYVGDPINCWVPAHFTGNHEEYANSYCWIKNTYYLPFEEYIPKEHEYEKRHMITYYQWIPLILLVQALLFYLPRLAWKGLNGRAAIDVDNVVGQAETFENAELAEKKETTLKNMTSIMHRFLSNREQNERGCTLSLTDCLSRVCCPVCGRRSGNYLTIAYLFVKCLYILNVIGQLFLLNAWLGQDFHFYGIDVITSLINDVDWRNSPRFPRVTMCDFKVRRLGNVQRYTVQCVLSINLFSEMIYLFIWFWMVFVAAMTCMSLLKWALASLSAKDRDRFVKKHLDLMDKIESDVDQRRADDFSKEYLRSDGVFILRLCGTNTDAVTVTEFICALYDNYIKKLMEDLTPTTDPDSSV